MNPKTDSASFAHVRKPRLSLFFATAAYVGYLPKAPGTWGSLVGVALYSLMVCLISILIVLFEPGVALGFQLNRSFANVLFLIVVVFGLVVAFLGVVTSGRIARFAGKKDPQIVVIDEVSGQFFTYLFALAPLNWKYLALGFILFRVFDIWKPFPVRQAESLPGGWGIMADDWIAAVYAAIGIWIARALGL